MASLCYFMVALGLIGSLLISPAQALTCKSQKFENKVYADCDDLPHLDAFIHWTYNSTNSSLSVAFQAPPVKPEGWVAWAINPTATGMAGAQALIAFLSNGAPTVGLLNISSYSSIVPSTKLSFDVWDLRVEHSDGKFKIFAVVKVPKKAKSVNQVWQVGSSMHGDSGVPAVHEFKPANLNARGALEFVKTSTHAGAPASSPGPAPSPGGGNGTAASATPSPDKGGDSRIRSRNLGWFVGLFVFIWGIIIF